MTFLTITSEKMILWFLFKDTMYFTNYFYFCWAIYIFNLWIIISITVNFNCFINKFLLCSNRFLTTFWAIVSNYMIMRSLIKNTMNFTQYFNFRFIVNVFNLWIIVFITMNFNWFINKILCLCRLHRMFHLFIIVLFNIKIINKLLEKSIQSLVSQKLQK